MQFLGVYINLFLGPFSPPWGPYMPSTYLFQTPPKKHQETVGFVNFEMFLNSPLSTNMETKYLSLENLRYNQVENDYVVCIIIFVFSTSNDS